MKLNTFALFALVHCGLIAGAKTDTKINTITEPDGGVKTLTTTEVLSSASVETLVQTILSTRWNTYTKTNIRIITDPAGQIQTTTEIKTEVSPTTQEVPTGTPSSDQTSSPTSSTSQSETPKTLDSTSASSSIPETSSPIPTEEPTITQPPGPPVITSTYTSTISCLGISAEPCTPSVVTKIVDFTWTQTVTTIHRKETDCRKTEACITRTIPVIITTSTYCPISTETITSTHTAQITETVSETGEPPKTSTSASSSASSSSISSSSSTLEATSTTQSKPKPSSTIEVKTSTSSSVSSSSTTSEAPKSSTTKAHPPPSSSTTSSSSFSSPSPKPSSTTTFYTSSSPSPKPSSSSTTTSPAKETSTTVPEPTPTSSETSTTPEETPTKPPTSTYYPPAPTSTPEETHAPPPSTTTSSSSLQLTTICPTSGFPTPVVLTIIPSPITAPYVWNVTKTKLSAEESKTAGTTTEIEVKRYYTIEGEIYQLPTGLGNVTFGVWPEQTQCTDATKPHQTDVKGETPKEDPKKKLRVRGSAWRGRAAVRV